MKRDVLIVSNGSDWANMGKDDVQTYVSIGEEQGGPLYIVIVS